MILSEVGGFARGACERLFSRTVPKSCGIKRIFQFFVLTLIVRGPIFVAITASQQTTLGRSELMRRFLTISLLLATLPCIGATPDRPSTDRSGRRNKIEVTRKVLIGTLELTLRDMSQSRRSAQKDPDKAAVSELLNDLKDRKVDPLNVPLERKKTVCGHIWACCDSGSWECCAGGIALCDWSW